MTRRLLVTLALGSTTGAGMGAASIAGAAAGAAHPQGASQPQVGAAAQPQAGASQPQAGSAAQPQLSQPLSQQLLFLHFRLPNSLSRRQTRFLPHGSQQLSHEGASQPQAGSHAGAQPLSQPLSHPLPHPLSHPLPQGKSFDSKPPQRFFFAQGSQQVSHAGASQPQAGSAAQPQAAASLPHAGSAAQPHAGASHPHAGSAAHPLLAASQPQAGSHDGTSQPVSQQLLALPQPFTPSIRSKRSNPKLWLQILQPRTRAIVIIVRFIGATSPLSQFGGLIRRNADVR